MQSAETNPTDLSGDEGERQDKIKEMLDAQQKKQKLDEMNKKMHELLKNGVMTFG